MRVGCVAAAGALAGCGKAPDASVPTSRAQISEPWFEEITERSGLHFIHDTGPTGRYLVPEQMGSGAALFDYDQDGRLDIYLVQNAGTNSRSVNRLFHQIVLWLDSSSAFAFLRWRVASLRNQTLSLQICRDRRFKCLQIGSATPLVLFNSYVVDRTGSRI